MLKILMSSPTAMAAISCLQINLNHSKLAQDCVANKIRALNNKQAEFIFCVQEPYVCLLYTSPSPRD